MNIIIQLKGVENTKNDIYGWSSIDLMYYHVNNNNYILEKKIVSLIIIFFIPYNKYNKNVIAYFSHIKYNINVSVVSMQVNQKI